MHVAMRPLGLNQLGLAPDTSRPKAKADLGSLQPPRPKRQKRGPPKEVVIKRPSAFVNPNRPKADTDWESDHKSGLVEVEFANIIEIYLNRVKTDYDLLRLPGYHSSDPPGSADANPGGNLRSHWSENVRRRLEQTSERFWRALFRYNAPDLLEEIESRSLTLAHCKKELPGQFFGAKASLSTNDILNLRRELLFHWSQDPSNLKALDFAPERDSVVIDGHLLQVP